MAYTSSRIPLYVNSLYPPKCMHSPAPAVFDALFALAALSHLSHIRPQYASAICRFLSYKQKKSSRVRRSDPPPPIENVVRTSSTTLSTGIPT